MSRRKPETIAQTAVRLFMAGTISEAQQILEIGQAVLAARQATGAAPRVRVRRSPTTTQEVMAAVAPTGPVAVPTVHVAKPPAARRRRRPTVAEKRAQANAAASVVTPRRGRGRPRLADTPPAALTGEANVLPSGTPLEAIPQTVDEA